MTATGHLDADERAEVDRRLAGHPLERMGTGQIRDLVRRLAAEVAPERFRARAAAARADRRVTLRPADDGMTYLTAHLPVEQGVACLAALHRAVVDAMVSPEPLTRSRGQIMADTLVERLTGQATAGDVNLAVQVTVPVEALVAPASPLPAEIPGHGPVPVALLTSTQGRKTWRRLVTRAELIRARAAGLAGLAYAGWVAHDHAYRPLLPEFGSRPGAPVGGSAGVTVYSPFR